MDGTGLNETSFSLSHSGCLDDSLYKSAALYLQLNEFHQLPPKTLFSRNFSKGNDFAGNQARLAKAVLEELPAQLTLFMGLKNIQPGPGRRTPVNPAMGASAPSGGPDGPPPPSYDSASSFSQPGAPPPPPPGGPQGASASAPYPPPASNPFYPSAP